MKKHAQAVVIGGGVIGCSVLYHLVKAGWRDTVLIERSELTSGSSWHAAGSFHTLNSDINIAKLQAYTIDLYPELQETSEQDCGLHITGGLLMAGTPERMDFLKTLHDKNVYIGSPTHLVTPKEAAELLPLLDPKHFLGGLWDPSEGHLDPSGTTHAYARASRILGGEIELRNPVIEIKYLNNGEWEIVTPAGNIRTPYLINAGGLWAREIGRMAGIELPVLAMEHMYLLTEDIPEVKEIIRQTGRELVHAIDLEGELYLRQEQNGMLIGTYEKDCVSWSDEMTPWDFDQQLLPPDLDRIAPSLEIGFEHFPVLKNAGIRQVINGPFTFSPDGNPLIGPVPGVPGFWCACAVMAGFSQGGGVGLALANWLIEGDPGFDVWGMDVARYGSHTAPAYTRMMVKQYYSRRFNVPYPNEQLPAARPLRTSALYAQLKQENAVFGVSDGLEHALWFQQKGQEPIENLTFRRSNAFAMVSKECDAIRNRVGIIEISNFAKYAVSGPQASAWLDGILANNLPDIGRIKLCPMLNEQGNLIGDFTVARPGANEFMIFGSGVAENYHMRWFVSHLPTDAKIMLQPIGAALGGVSVVGPDAFALLNEFSEGKFAVEDLKFFDFRRMYLGSIPVSIGRLSVTGSAGYEIWLAPEYMNALFTGLMQAGKDYGIRPFGAYALNSLRLEKSYGTWACEYRSIYSPFEAGLGAFIALDKPGDFIGKEALGQDGARELAYKLVTLVVDSDDVDVSGDEPIYQGSEPIGWVTSGGYGHYCQKSIAMGYVNHELADSDEDFEIPIIGDKHRAKIQKRPLYDPLGKQMRKKFKVGAK